MPWALAEALLGDVPPEKRRSALVRHVAWTSPLNAFALVGADGEVAPSEAHARYARLAARPEPHPRILALDRPTLGGLHQDPTLAREAELEALARTEADKRLGLNVRP